MEDTYITNSIIIDQPKTTYAHRAHTHVHRPICI